MKTKLFVVAVVVLFAAVATVTVSFLRQHTTCDDLTGGAEGHPVDQTLLFELGGNTQSWADAASAFVRERLTDELDAHPEVPAVVRIRFEVDGRTIVARTTCLRSELLLTGPKSDLENFRVGTASTKSDVRTRLIRTRQEQIDVIAESVADEVRHTAFSRTPVLTVLPLWQDAAESPGAVSILSPLVSTAQDCLQAQPGEEPSATALVRDCIAAGEMTPLRTDRVHIENFGFLAESAGQKAAAREMIDALSTCGTAVGCGTTMSAPTGSDGKDGRR